MRVVMIVPGGVDRSGQERVIPALLWLIERLARRHQVLVIALRQEPQASTYPLLGAEVANLGEPAVRMAGLGLQQQLRQVRRAVRDHGGADVIHAFWIGTTSTLAVLIGRWLRVPVVVSIGGGELVWLPDIGYGGVGTWRGRMHANLACRLASAVTGGSQYVLETVRRQRPDAQWVPLGIDLGLYGGPVDRPAGPPWRLLHVASINRVKDQTTLLLALRQVLDEEPGVHLDWVGEDTLNGALQKLAAELGVAHAVRFHGVLPVHALPPLYRQAHLLVQSSRHESQGVAVCEAAACGVPTVGTAVGLVDELAPPAAWRVPVGDPLSLAAGIVALLHESTQRHQMGTAAQAWAQAHDADWTAHTFEALYAQLTAQSNGRGTRTDDEHQR
jgi:glycosyltransferase involved in cell wall biosynthesis